MAKVDEAEHDLELCVVVVGGASERFCGALALKDGKLALAELQGWRPRLAFHSFGADPWGGAAESGTPILKALVKVMLRPTGRPPPVS